MLLADLATFIGINEHNIPSFGGSIHDKEYFSDFEVEMCPTSTVEISEAFFFEMLHLISTCPADGYIRMNTDSWCSGSLSFLRSMLFSTVSLAMFVVTIINPAAPVFETSGDILMLKDWFASDELPGDHSN
jgi:hypothetical protein